MTFYLVKSSGKDKAQNTDGYYTCEYKLNKYFLKILFNPVIKSYMSGDKMETNFRKIIFKRGKE